VLVCGDSTRFSTQSACFAASAASASRCRPSFSSASEMSAWSMMLYLSNMLLPAADLHDHALGDAGVAEVPGRGPSQVVKQRSPHKAKFPSRPLTGKHLRLPGRSSRREAASPTTILSGKA